MLMTIDCPSCGDPLQVPENAAGRRARCNHCDGRFVVPSAEELLESTVSHFALDEMDHRRREHRYDDASARPGASDAGRSKAASADGTVLGISAVSRNPEAGEPGETTLGVPLTMDRMGDSVAGAPSTADHPAPAKGPEGDPDNPDGLHLVGEDQSPAKPAVEPAGKSASSSGSSAGAAGSSAADAEGFPQELQPGADRPHLVVRRVSVDGVLMAFDTRWLHHERFRCSVPLRSAFNGEADRTKLTARPMVFLDAVTDPSPRARPIELRYEVEAVRAEDTPAAIAGRMGNLQNLRAPFERPIVYYAHADASQPALLCRVKSLGDERDVQVGEVLVPSGRMAIDWLAAVNGQCGDDYALLSREVERSGQTAWDELPQKVRQRLEPWCGFQRGEQFLAYFNDPDFTSNERGLAGVVVTNKRLVYHKYRRLRSVSLHSAATLHLRKDGLVTRLTVTAGERRAKAGKMSHARVPEFLEVLPKGHRLALDAPHLGMSSRAV